MPQVAAAVLKSTPEGDVIAMYLKQAEHIAQQLRRGALGRGRAGQQRAARGRQRCRAEAALCCGRARRVGVEKDGQALLHARGCRKPGVTCQQQQLCQHLLHMIMHILSESLS